MKGYLLMIIGIVMVSGATAQIDTVSTTDVSNNEVSMEEYVRKNASLIDFSDSYLSDTFIKGNRININDATETELSSLHLNEIQIANLTSYIEKYGALAGIYELNLIEGFDSALIVRLEPQLSFKIRKELHNISLKSLTGNGRHSLLSRWSRTPGKQLGYVTDGYAGGPDKILLKYGYKFYNRIRFGITMEKDPGEAFTHGFDFYSAHLFYQGKGFVRSLVIGDYFIRFGQGLTINNSFSLFNENMPTAPVTQINGIRPATGANESGPFRGSALCLALHRYTRLTMFWSQKKIDAGLEEVYGINDSVMSSDLLVRSIYESGLHRTKSEIAGKDKIVQSAYGLNIGYVIGCVRIGATAINTVFSENIVPKHELYSQFRFSGNNLSNYGVDVKAILGDLTFAGEISKCNTGGMALITSMHYLPYADFGITLNYRNYQRNYHNFFSNAWSQSSYCSNEQGLSAGLFFNPSKRTTISALAEHYYHPWLTYTTDKPSSGIEYIVKFNYSKPYREELLFRYGYDRKTGDSADTERHNMRIHLSYHPTNIITLRNRLELTLHKSGDSPLSSGFLIYQDIIVKPQGNRYQLNLRYALFNTDSFNERIYAHEDDLPLSYSVVPYYYSGSRFYVTGKYSISGSTDIWLRYSYDFYPGKVSTGTGNDKMEGNTRSEISIQLMLRL